MSSQMFRGLNVMRVQVSVVALAIGLAACRVAQNPKDDAKRAFIRWNALALAHNKQAANYLCRGIKVDDGTQLIPANHPGFAQITDTEVAFANDDRAEINFRESVGSDDRQVVYLNLVKQSGQWKVCGVQITAEGGFG